MVTVLGGTGFLGSRIVRQLSASGHRVRIAARHPERRPDLLQLDGVEAARADLLEPASLSDALAGATGAVNATSLYLETDDLTFEALHVEAAERLARSARLAGVRRLVQMSGIGADPDADDGYISARGRGEVAVGGAFPGAIIVRPSTMFGRDDAFLTAILALLRRSPVYPLFGAGGTRLQPVSVEDVAGGIVRILDADLTDPLYEFGGPKIYAYRDLVEAIAGIAGRSVRTVPVPFTAWRILSAISERVPGAPLTRSQVALMRNDNVAAPDIPGLPELGQPTQDILDFVRKFQS